MLDAEPTQRLRAGCDQDRGQDRIQLNADLKAGAGGNVTLYGNDVAVNANVAAHGGSIRLGNVLSQMASNGSMEDTSLPCPLALTAGVAVRRGVRWTPAACGATCC
ncbi:hypothetical protein ACU4GD_31825 [Cupriavidus basilensis]